MKVLATLLLVAGLWAVGCTAAVSEAMPVQTLNSLQALNQKPELVLPGPRADFLITPDTKVEIFLTHGEVVSTSAADILTNGDSVVLKGRAQTFLLRDVARVRYTSTY